MGFGGGASGRMTVVAPWLFSNDAPHGPEEARWFEAELLPHEGMLRAWLRRTDCPNQTSGVTPGTAISTTGAAPHA